MRYFISCLAGLLFGSFANVCILRLPNDASLLFPRSHCPHCGQSLRNIDNIPLISFLILKGQCRTCRAPISWQYPLIEALMAALFMSHAWYFADSLPRLVAVDMIGFYLLTISIIDYRHRIIPDELSLSLLVIGISLSAWNPYLMGSAGIKLLHSFAAAVGGGAIMLLLAYAGEKAFKKEALGGGDVKLIAASGAALGWGGIIGPLLLGSMTGGLVAIILMLLKKKKLGETLPFGPFLSFGIYISCLFPDWWNMLFWQ